MSRFLQVTICALLSVAGMLCATPAWPQANLLGNPTFGAAAAPSLDGWDYWQRDDNGGSCTVSRDAPVGEHWALEVAYTGPHDWSVAAHDSFAVHPGEILEIGGWVKTLGTGNVNLSVVTRDATGQVLNWSCGTLDFTSTPDWAFRHRKLLVPLGCATVQFRMIGYGTGSAWLSGPIVTRAGELSATRRPAQSIRIGNPSLDLTLNTISGTITVADRRDEKTWTTIALGPDEVIVKATASGRSTARLSLWDFSEDRGVSAIFAVSPTAPQFRISVSGAGPLESYAYPPAFRTRSGESLVIPMNEGILYPVDDLSVGTRRFQTYCGNYLSMPWYGIVDDLTGAGLMAVVNTPDDARLDLGRDQTSGLLQIAPVWEASRGVWRYTRDVTCIFFTKGGYVAQAKRYRLAAQELGLFKTLNEKRRDNPNVDRLLGAADVWCWDTDGAGLCREMKAAGMDNVLWAAGGEPAELSQINGLGYLSSRYDIYQDVYPPNSPTWLTHEGWPSDLVLLKEGSWMKGWASNENKPDGSPVTYQGGVINSARGLARARQKIPADLATHPFTCRFLDTTTASPWREDYSLSHPLTRSEDRRNKMALLQFCSGDMKLVTGSETGIDTAVPYVDYFEGMMSLAPYRLPDAGRNMADIVAPTPDILKFQVGVGYRIPLWELVYHDCVVSYWYWGDYNNKMPEVWDRRDLFDMLYGVPPVFMLDQKLWDRDKDKFAASYHRIGPLARELACDEMLTHAFITADHTVQETTWRSGTRVFVNFGSIAYKLANGDELAPLSCRVLR